MTAYYNEISPSACQWLANLMELGAISPGVIDSRSIADVTAGDLVGFDRCHFFAGIGIWDYALTQAGWQGEVWTGSAPCQPFSSAGQQKGFDDERHLWPEFHRLIAECRPKHVFGEQVAGKNGLTWLDAVQHSLGESDYACGHVVAPGCLFGAPHKRQRLYWVAEDQLADTDSDRRDKAGERITKAGCDGVIGDGAAERLADAIDPGSQGGLRGGQDTQRGTIDGHTGCDSADSRPGPTNGYWRDADWLFCRDGKWRPVEPGTSPLAHGTAKRVVKGSKDISRANQLKGYGNCIVAPQAIEFVKAYMESGTR